MTLSSKSFADLYINRVIVVTECHIQAQMQFMILGHLPTDATPIADDGSAGEYVCDIFIEPTRFSKGHHPPTRGEFMPAFRV